MEGEGSGRGSEEGTKSRMRSGKQSIADISMMRMTVFFLWSSIQFTFTYLEEGFVTLRLKLKGLGMM